MDTNKENELMQNLERQTPPPTDGHLADGRPQKKGAAWLAVNPPQSGAQNPGQASSQADIPAIEQVDAEMVNRIEAFGAEAVYDAGRDA